MSKLLAIETAGAACSVALNIDGDVRQLVDETPKQHARKLLPMVDRLLAEASMVVGGLDGIAFTCGPGSFTGLRIGFGVVQGMAFGGDLPVLGLSTLEVMAHRALAYYKPKRGVLAPALDARMGEVYLAVFHVEESGQLIPALADCAVSIDAAAEKLPVDIDIAIGDGWSILGDGKFATRVRNDGFFADAETVADLAAGRFHGGLFHSVDQAELAYIRNEVSWKKRTRLRVDRELSR